MTSTILNRYIQFLGFFLYPEPKELTWDQIAEKWNALGLSEGRPLPKRTFHMYKDAVEELFGVEFGCDSSKGYAYFVKNPEVLEERPIHQWLLAKYSVPEDFITFRAMKERILLEKVFGESGFVHTIIESLDSQRTITVDYQPYGRSSRSFHMQPYALKVHDRLWYVVGYVPEEDDIRTIALDKRVNPFGIELTNEHYNIPEDFDGSKYFDNVVGIYVNKETKPETVRIRVYGDMMHIIQDKPLHKSQKRVRGNLESAEYQYRVCVTKELENHLLAMGEDVEVLDPENLRERIKERLNLTLKRYEL